MDGPTTKTAISMVQSIVRWILSPCFLLFKVSSTGLPHTTSSLEHLYRFVRDAYPSHNGHADHAVQALTGHPHIHSNERRVYVSTDMLPKSAKLALVPFDAETRARHRSRGWRAGTNP